MQIDQLSIPGTRGAIALMPCPGRGGLLAALTGTRRSALARELQGIRRWGAEALVTLVEPGELRALGVPHIGEEAASAGLEWFHMPIPDFCAPGRSFEREWERHGDDLRARLLAGSRIAMHCLAGLGRTGTVAARILVELGVEPREAVSAVRLARPGSIQSEEQLDYLLERRWELPGASDRRA